MALRTSLWLGVLAVVLLMGAVACLTGGVILLTATAVPADESGSASQGNEQPVLGNNGNDANACSHEQHDDGRHLGDCGDQQGHRSLRSGGDTTAGIGSGGAERRSLPPAPGGRGVAAGAALLVLAALLLAASIAVFVVARRRALLRPRAAGPDTKPPAEGEPREPGVAVIEPRVPSPAAQEKWGLPPEYETQPGPWAHPPPADNPYYVPAPYGLPPHGLPPPTYSEACEGPG